jgi:hypothetical protein
MPEKNDRNNYYDLREVTQDSRTYRTFLRPGRCDELVGVDLRTQGGLRVFPGMKRVRQLTQTITNMLNFFPVSFHVGAAEIWHGFIYRATISGVTKIYLEYYDGTSWLEQEIVANDTSTGQMDVAVFGRLMYVFREGLEPILVYIDTDTDNTPTVVTDTGPGTAPGYPDDDLFVEGRIGHALSETDSSQSTGQDGTGTLLEPSPYSLCYQLRNTVTGRVSPLSMVDAVEEREFPTDTEDVREPQYLKLVIDDIDTDGLLTKYDEIHIYRSIRVSFAGGLFAGASIYFRDAVRTFDATVVTDGTFEHVYELPDQAIVTQDVYENDTQFLEDMPFARAALVHQGVMYTANQNQEGTSPVAVSELRWSNPSTSIGGASVELFPPRNRQTLGASTEVPIAFRVVGDQVIGLCPSNHLMIFKAGSAVRAQAMHESSGLASQFGCSVFEDMVHVNSRRGLVGIDRSGGLVPHNALDRLLIRDWAANRSSLYVVSDPSMGVICVHNPTLAKTALLWANTRAVSMLEHMDFPVAATGIIPDASDTEEERALFVTPEGLVCRFDDTFSKDQLSMMEVTGDPGMSLKATSALDTTGTGASLSGMLWDTETLVGARIVVLSGDSIGESRRIVTASESAPNTSLTLDSALTIDTGDIVAISPVVFRVIGWPYGIPEQEEIGRDSFRGKTVVAIGCHFQSVTGDLSADTTVARFRGGIYKGLESSPENTAYPTKGDGTNAVSVANGVGRYYAKIGDSGSGGPLLFPEVLIYAVSLDFVLISLSVGGTIHDGDNYDQAPE